MSTVRSDDGDGVLHDAIVAHARAHRARRRGHADGLGRSDPDRLRRTHDGVRRAHLRTARRDLSEIALRLHPKLLEVQRLEGETVVMLYRPLMVDLLEATGMDAREARDVLPAL